MCENVFKRSTFENEQKLIFSCVRKIVSLKRWIEIDEQSNNETKNISCLKVIWLIDFINLCFKWEAYGFEQSNWKRGSYFYSLLTVL